jgi:hypothetical protein
LHRGIDILSNRPIDLINKPVTTAKTDGIVSQRCIIKNHMFVDFTFIDHIYTNQINEHKQFLPKHPDQQQQHYNQGP